MIATKASFPYLVLFAMLLSTGRPFRSSHLSRQRKFPKVSAKNYFESLFGTNNNNNGKSSSDILLEEVPEKLSVKSTDSITSSGLIPYIGVTEREGERRWAIDRLRFKQPTPGQLWKTKFNLWKQLPWKKIRGKTILKVKVKGPLALEQTPTSFSFTGTQDLEVVDSLMGLNTLFTYAALDPRVVSIIIDISALTCGYGKLREVRRVMDYFRQSGKEIIGYCAAGSEKELYLGVGCSALYVPPDGSLDLRGFSSGAAFVRGLFDKVGLEPQVQRIGKYKSFGDTFNRTSISEAQREVISSLILEGSDYWADDIGQYVAQNNSELHSMNVSSLRNKVMKELWERPGVKTPYDLADMGYITGVNYLDEVEIMIKAKHRINSTSYFSGLFNFFSSSASDKNCTDANETVVNYSLTDEFVKYPRRNLFQDKTNNVTGSWSYVSETGELSVLNETSVADSAAVSEEVQKAVEEAKQAEKNAEKAAVESAKAKLQLAKREPSVTPGALYLRKMRKGGRILQGLPVTEAVGGPRIAIINAAGSINTGKSGNSMGSKNIGSDTVISQLRRVRDDPGIRAVVLRIDSPGGSALASDLMWREIRVVSRSKPVIASMVDVAASGGYYMAMACDHIVAEDMTVTGSIGVVYSKFNAKELFEKIGYSVEVLSRGRFAEVLSTSRGFTEDEKQFFEALGLQSYDSFITKAAASRNMSKDNMQEVAQGRVWTGRQALQRGLVDQIGGLGTALELAVAASKMPVKNSLSVQTITDFSRSLPFPLSLLSSTIEEGGDVQTESPSPVMTLCDETISTLQLASPESMGVNKFIQKLGLTPALAFILSHNEISKKAVDVATQTGITSDVSLLKKLKDLL
mmetsp:Transcript_13294/g.13357  ORF Transcript_13294/g.13357 Transcript_13294/m.13357 type:complete len:859 (+) Transcript_13294:48-2624(+)|eukprot:CAMPEP_0182427684 /NCGR_PEP_ID=MMETSP1167-20130531/18980_1 /TAXON_ID=2988 /ORGANISM="Mallomonas Sp, Strain CCMP3275" /LENGTH=858 /DNA_ID=CAMNT_0024610107 /DNA_START=42 /DNA_END=2618 /DNA_ORIENTATION=-